MNHEQRVEILSAIATATEACELAYDKIKEADRHMLFASGSLQKAVEHQWIAFCRVFGKPTLYMPQLREMRKEMTKLILEAKSR